MDQNGKKRMTIFPGSSANENRLMQSLGSIPLPQESVYSSTESRNTILSREAPPLGDRPVNPKQSHDTIIQHLPFKTAQTTNKSAPREDKLVPGFTSTFDRQHRQRSVANGSNSILVNEQSPWKHYRPLFDMMFGDHSFIPVAQNEQDLLSSRDSKLVVIKELSGPNIHEQLQRLQEIKHSHFVAVGQLYHSKNNFYAVFDALPLALFDLTSNPLLDEITLASILGQILEGLSALAQMHYEHGQLTCSNIWLDLEGNVKIWGFEHAYPSPDSRRDIQALSRVTMELMQGHARENGIVGVDDETRWPSDSRAFDFLTATTTTKKISELKKHPLLQLPWHIGYVKGLAALSRKWAKPLIRYPSNFKL